MSCTIVVNIPFALGRCDYYGRGLRANVPPAEKHAYLDALTAEVQATLPDVAAADETVGAVVFANGALGTVEPDRLRHLLRCIADAAPLAPGCKVYAEVDPGLVSTALMDELRTRDFELAMLRFHYFTSDALESERLGRPCAVPEMAKTRIVMDSAAFHAFDMQILVGLSRQTEKTLLKTLREAVLIPGVAHCTLLAPHGALAADAQTATELQATAEGFLAEHGFARYAPSYFARPGGELPFVARENAPAGPRATEGDAAAQAAPASASQPTGTPALAGPVVSLGPGGISCLGGLTWENTPDLDAYVRAGGKAEAITVRIEEKVPGVEQ